MAACLCSVSHFCMFPLISIPFSSRRAPQLDPLTATMEQLAARIASQLAQAASAGAPAVSPAARQYANTALSLLRTAKERGGGGADGRGAGKESGRGRGRGGDVG